MIKKQEFLDRLKDPIGYELEKGLTKFKDKLFEKQFDYITDHVDGAYGGAYRIRISSDDQKALDLADEYFQYCFRKIPTHCNIVKKQAKSRYLADYDTSVRSYYVSKHELSYSLLAPFKGTITTDNAYFYCPYVPFKNYNE